LLTFPSSGIPATRIADVVSHTLDDLGALGKFRRGLDLGGDCGLELGSFGGQALQDAGMRFLDWSRCSMLVLALQSRLEFEQIFARFHQCQQLLVRGIVDLARRLAKCLGEPGDHLGVDRIVLCQAPGR
jgi:hypothetical protein